MNNSKVKEIKNNLIYELKIQHGKGKIASFDLDSTLIKTASGRRFAKDKNDWELLNSRVKSELKGLHDKGFDIIIFTNQKPLAKNLVKQRDFLEKISDITKELGIEISYFICTGGGYFRKPCTGPFDILKSYLLENHGVEEIHKESFYCGDEAGRPVGWKWQIMVKDNKTNKTKTVYNTLSKKDFSSSDRFFAYNCGLKFLLPEHIFYDIKTHDSLDHPKAFCPKLLINKKSKLNDNEFNTIEGVIKLLDKSLTGANHKKANLIILTGYPSSGKSYLAKEIVNKLDKLSFDILNLDTIKNKRKLNSMFKDKINSNQNIIIDNTNVKSDDRKKFIVIAQKKNYNVISIEVTTDDNLVKHLNYYRSQSSKNKREFISSIVYNVMRKKYESPSLNEGFNKLIKYRCEPKLDEQYKEFYYSYFI